MLCYIFFPLQNSAIKLITWEQPSHTYQGEDIPLSHKEIQIVDRPEKNHQIISKLEKNNKNYQNVVNEETQIPLFLYCKNAT